MDTAAQTNAVTESMEQVPYSEEKDAPAGDCRALSAEQRFGGLDTVYNVVVRTTDGKFVETKPVCMQCGSTWNSGCDQQKKKTECRIICFWL